MQLEQSVYWVVNQSLPESHACKSNKTILLCWQARNCDQCCRFPNRQVHNIGGRYLDWFDYSVQVVRHLGTNRHPNEEHFRIDVLVVQAWNFSPSPNQDSPRWVHLQDNSDYARLDLPLRHEWLQLRPALWKIFLPVLHVIPNSNPVLARRNLTYWLRVQHLP